MSNVQSESTFLWSTAEKREKLLSRFFLQRVVWNGVPTMYSSEPTERRAARFFIQIPRKPATLDSELQDNVRKVLETLFPPCMCMWWRRSHTLSWLFKWGAFGKRNIIWSTCPDMRTWHGYDQPALSCQHVAWVNETAALGTSIRL